MAKTPVRRLIERGIEAGADYIPDAFEVPLRKVFNMNTPSMTVTPKAKPKPSMAVTPKAKPKQLALPAPPKQLALPAPGPGLPSFAVKPRGGQWWADKNIIHGNNSPEAAARQSASYLDTIVEGFGEANRPFASADLTSAPVWLQRALTKYLKNDFGTPEDPLRDLAARGLHYDAYVTPEQWQRTVNSTLIKSPIGDVLFPSNSAGGMPGAGSDLRGEAMTAMPWLAKLPVTDNIYGIHHQGLNLDHFTDELYNALNAGSAGLPPHLAVRPESLDRMTFPQAAEHVGKINQFRAKEMERVALGNLDSPAVRPFKDYAEDNPMGLRWVQLKAPDPEGGLPEGWQMSPDRDGFLSPEGEFFYTYPGQGQYDDALQDALKYEGDTMGHCVGGYCPDVMSGRSSIFSLRDAKGEPHVTIETRPGRRLPGSQSIPRDVEAQLAEQAKILAKEMMQSGYMTKKGASERAYHKLTSEWLSKQPPLADDIIQIKGKQNRAPKDDYLPFVQDFVKSQQWGNVGDMRNTGLVRLPDGRYITPQQAEEAITAIPERVGNAVYDPTYLHAMDPEIWKQVAPYFEGFAVGGRVSADRCFSKGKSAVYAVNKARK